MGFIHKTPQFIERPAVKAGDTEERPSLTADGGRGLRRGEEQTDKQDNCSASYKDHA
jgi:hypothetical protein